MGDVNHNHCVIEKQPILYITLILKGLSEAEEILYNESLDTLQYTTQEAELMECSMFYCMRMKFFTK